MQRGTMFLAVMVLTYAAGCGESQPGAPAAGNGGAEVTPDPSTDPTMMGGTANGHADANAAAHVDDATSVGDPTTAPTTDPALDPADNPTADPTLDPAADPAVDPATDPAVDPATDPAVDPATDPAAKPTEGDDQAAGPKTVDTPTQAFAELNRLLIDRIRKRLGPKSGTTNGTNPSDPNADTPEADPAIPGPETP